jgi:lambda family phage portal protein
MLGRTLDSLIAVVSPKWAANRAAYRAHYSTIAAASGRHRSMEKLIGSNSRGGYEAGKSDRLKGYSVACTHENDIPQAQIDRLRFRSWQLFRNNPQARKICRTLCAKVIGRGLSPQPQTVTVDGDPFVAFRKRARQVWDEFCKEADFRGKPGRGGQHFTSLAKTALRAVMLSGGTLFRFRHIDRTAQKDLGLMVPLQIQLLHIDRLDDTKHGPNNFRGVEFDAEGKPVRYHVKTSDLAGNDKTIAVSAKEMGHLFAEDDIDQIMGAPWFGAALLTMDDRRSYEYSELIAAEMGSCIVAGYRRSRGQTGGISLPGTDANYELTDGDGNKITHLQPGMFVDLGTDGEIQMVNPQRPNSMAGEFIGHLLRTEAVSMPGIKGSTLTGDYRNSSFSSERSADNDTWPEIEELQDWFSVGFCQPIYEEVIASAVLAGLFDDVEGFSPQDFSERKREYLKTNWQGPVLRSINPVDDADASRQRVKNANSSPQREAAQIGRDWREILQELAEFKQYAEEIGLPADIWQQALGIEQGDSPAPAAPADRPTEQQQDDANAIARFRNSGFLALNSAGTK